jgi:hypothetical protein
VGLEELKALRADDPRLRDDAYLIPVIPDDPLLRECSVAANIARCDDPT